MNDERPEKPLTEGSLPEKSSPEKSSPEKPVFEKPVFEKSGSEVPLPQLRASDADRERVVERLRDAVAEGRLDMDEFEERLEAAYTSRTYAELEPLTRDLPAVGAAAPLASAPSGPPVERAGSGAAWADRIGGEATWSTGIAVMSGFQRKGRWTVPARFDAFAFMGGGELDLREANFAQSEVVINCVAVMGGIEITVPPGVEVDVRGIGFMGAFDQRESRHAPEPGAPRVVVTGLALMGGVDIRVKEPKAPKGLKGSKSVDGPSLRKEL
ncbi:MULTISPECIES: DUF1707 domain-containing protein [unclassified Streptomyces]|uniref:DUF1707 SHOCT-like domain-containing protein n=1 Tax=unclassified Streptomyces TaxID=2593676 RepID=UPI00109E4474|nr:DUF1707 domain-containing protein [Streptomyces sp. A1136]THA53837.1 DUF1707 and DUF2154 domain-containing protein [Streptomyces sp. A1136]